MTAEPRQSWDPMADLKKWSKLIADMPERVAYIVTDHAIPAFSHIDDHDGQGRRYLHVNPSFLDSLKHVKEDPQNALNPTALPASLTGIPLYRRENMPEGWPDAR